MIGWGHVPPRYLKHVLQRRPANSRLVGLVLGGWRLPERLAIILLVQATPTAAYIGSIVSLHEQIGSFAGLAGGDVRRRDFHASRQGQAERLVLNAARKARRVRLENMRRWRAVHRDADAAGIVDGDGKLGLRAGQRHRDPLLADEERLVRQFLYDPLKVFRLAHRPPLNGGGSPGLADRERARGVAADRGEQSDHIAARHPEKLSERSQLLVLRQQVCGPGQENVGRRCAPVSTASVSRSGTHLAIRSSRDHR